MVNRRPSGQAANVKNAVISLQKLLSSNAANHVLQTTVGPARIADSSSTNAVSFSSVRTTKRFPSSRCASATKIVRPRESTVATQPQLQPALLRLLAMIFPILHPMSSVTPFRRTAWLSYRFFSAPPPRLSEWRSRAWSTMMRRINCAAAAIKWLRPCQTGFVSSTSRR